MIARATGPRPLTYQWRKAGIDIPGATEAKFTITNITEADRATYSVLVADGITSGISSVKIDFIRPVFAQQPQSLAAVPGSTVSFSAGAIGVAPLTYQWHRLQQAVDATIPNATDTTLILTNISPSDSGDYWVQVVSEGELFFESRNSTSAVLTVITNNAAHPPLLENPVFVTDTFKFTLATEAGQTYEVQFTPSLADQTSWSAVQTILGDGTVRLVTLTGVTLQGYYRVKLLP